MNGKKASLGKTYKTQTEANDKGWDLNRKTEKALDTMAILCARFDKVSRVLGEIDQQFDKDLVDMQDALERPRRLRCLQRSLPSKLILNRRISMMKGRSRRRRGEGKNGGEDVGDQGAAAKVQAVKTEGQVKVKRMSILCERRFSVN